MSVTSIVKRSVGGSLAMVLGLILLCMPAQSAPLFYNFDIEFEAGDLSGRTFMGSFSIEGDDLNSVGIEAFGRRLSNRLLSFEITIDGVGLYSSDSFPYSMFPQVGFANGVVTWVKAYGFGDTQFLRLTFIDLKHISVNRAIFFDGDSYSVGRISRVSPAEVLTPTPTPTPTPVPVPVPTPATATLLVSGLVALGALRRRRLRT